MIGRDPGLVLHLTGDEASDAAQLERLGVELEGFDRVAEGLSGPGYEVALCSGESSELAHLGAFPLGASSTLELWLRPRGDDLEGFVLERTLRLQGAREPRPQPKLRVNLEFDGFHRDRSDGGFVELLPEALTSNRWHHLAIAHDLGTTGTVRVVLDGEVQVIELGESPEAARFDVGEDTGGAYLFVHVAAPGLALDLDELRLFDRYVSTEELRRRWRSGIGAMGTPTVLTGPLLDSPEAWTAGTFERVVPDRDGADWVAAHWAQDRPAPGPHARTCHAVVSAGPGRLLVFGGELRDTHAGRMANGDDAWLYHLDEQRWERVAGGATGRTSTELRAAFAATVQANPREQRPAGSRLHSAGPRVLPDFELTHGPAPGPRCHQGMAFDPATGKALLLGGWFNAPGGGFQYGDVWLFDVATGRWTEHVQAGPVPSVGDQQPVFHAGLGRFLFLTRHAVWSVDPGDGLLRREPGPLYVDEELQPVEPRTTAQAMTWYDPDLELVVRFGGFWITPPSEAGAEPQKERTSDLLVYSHEFGAWVLRETPDVAPSPRVRGAVAYDTRRDRAVLFGGITGGLDDRANDLWTYATETNTWTELRASNAPGPRGGYFGMAYDEERDVFVLPFGRQDTDVFLDEVWRLRFDDEAWGSATWRFDREGWQPGLEAAVEWQGPEGAEGDLEPRVLLRGSDDGVAFGDWGSDVGSERFVELRVELAPGMRLTSVAFE
ncbi:MAG: kelch repeat-containing protein [Planctomycetota bacterium]|nr:kelch repeat-containing protein [Planctomycetota bacterium]